jgi:hypothetical protein
MSAPYDDTEKLKRLFHKLKYEAHLSPSYETEHHVLEIGEEIAKREPQFLVTYFPFLLSFKEKYGKISEPSQRRLRINENTNFKNYMRRACLDNAAICSFLQNRGSV